MSRGDCCTGVLERWEGYVVMDAGFGLVHLLITTMYRHFGYDTPHQRQDGNSFFLSEA